ncbi:hypothetical protein [Terrimonas pollutisoli]|uniref:hypothetical protein n=1 Tax=Terrimonas pollutisoli TaxID=3034147 RepID=UPI0023ECDBD7|nr:hypothetical protein [Terrimonas sp. H1YJ31]
MPVKEKDDDIIIRIPRKLYDKNVQQFLDYIQFRKIVSKSKATEKDINKILADIKKERGPRVQALLKKAGIKP